MFADDESFLGPLLEGLRNGGKIEAYKDGPPSSRFGVSARDWDDFVRPAVAQRLGLDFNRVRLETAIEASIIPQLLIDKPRVNDGKTDTWMWYEEFFEGADFRLCGGRSDSGGLADVGWGYSGEHWGRRAFRPLGVLAP